MEYGQTYALAHTPSGVAVGVGVLVGVGVTVGVAVAVGVLVGVAVDVLVGVAVAVGSGIGSDGSKTLIITGSHMLYAGVAVGSCAATDTTSMDNTSVIMHKLLTVFIVTS